MRRLSASDPHGQLAHLAIVAGDAPRTSFLELRYRLASGGMRQEFHTIADRLELLAVMNDQAPAVDVYVGCAPRAFRDGRKQGVEQLWTLWAECDGASSSAAARRHMPRPALVIASGTPGNVHAYWPLRHPLSAQEAERANLRLASALGADQNCFDAARILRPPGTWNHKRSPATPVEVLEHRVAVRFEVDQVVGALPHVNVAGVDRRWDPRQPGRGRSDPLLRITPPEYVGALLGVRAAPGTKVRCPFHADERPSLHIYPSAERGWYCFSCCRGGSIYDLAAEVWGMGTRGRAFHDLRRRLGEAFARELGRGPWANDEPTLTR